MRRIFNLPILVMLLLSLTYTITALHANPTFDIQLGNSTLLGGSNADGVEGVHYVPSSDVQGGGWIFAQTLSSDFPVTAGPQNHLGSDCTLSRVNGSGEIVWSKLIGGDGTDLCADFQADSEGSLYALIRSDRPDAISGLTFRRPNPTFTADIVLIKLDPANGNILWGTNFGGSAIDTPMAMHVEEIDRVLIAGWTESSNLFTRDRQQGDIFQVMQPTKGNFKDGFVLRVLGAAIIWGTYIGGNEDDGASDILVDGQGNFYVSGGTRSLTNFKPMPGNSAPATVNSWLVKIAPTTLGYSPVWSRYLWGVGLVSEGAGLTLDNQGNVYVTGSTYTSNLGTLGTYQPAKAAGTDGIIAKIDTASGAIVTATYIGGNGRDGVGHLIFDRGNPTFLAGTDENIFGQSTGFDTQAGLAQVTPDLSTLVYSHLWGGRGPDYVASLVVDSTGSIITVVGQTLASDYPVTDGSTFKGYSDLFWTTFKVSQSQPTTPAAPTNLVATATGKDSVQLTWDDNADNEVGFEIQRCTGANCSNFTTLVTLPVPGLTAFAEIGLTARTSYSYRVRACNDAGCSTWSNTASATTQAETDNRLKTYLPLVIR